MRALDNFNENPKNKIKAHDNKRIDDDIAGSLREIFIGVAWWCLE